MVATATIATKKLTIPQIRAAYPGRSEGRPLSASTITRWILQGCMAVSGQKVRLRASRCGYRWLIDPEDLEAFFAALGGDAAEEARSPAARNRSSEAASKELDAIGA